MPELTEFQVVYLRHRALGYSRRASVRLALWVLNPEAPLYPENTK